MIWPLIYFSYSKFFCLKVFIYLNGFLENEMADRRGHRKLRLCSNKHYERKKYFPKKLLVSIPRMNVNILKVSIPLRLLSYNVSLPLSVYTELPAPSLEIMQRRIQQLGILSEGTMKLVALTYLTFYIFRMSLVYTSLLPLKLA